MIIDPKATWRIRVALLFCCLLFGFLMVYLWHLQVVRGHTFSKEINKRSIRRVRIPEIRGRIFDRHGEVLADNLPSYSIGFYIEEMRQPPPWSNTVNKVEETIQYITERTGIQPDVTRKEIAKHVIQLLPLPLVAWKDLNTTELSRFSERVKPIPGVSIITETKRVYPNKSLGCHAIGYVKRDVLIDPNDPQEKSYNYYLPQWVGVAGLEKSMDHYLRGEAGGELLRIDVIGYRHEVLARREPRNGDDIYTTLDLRIQRIADRALEQEPGAVVVMDPTNGDILALASYPSYDLNDWIPGISHKKYQALINDPRAPLVNRATGGQYPPGSTFKPLVAMAGLESGLIPEDQTYYCSGYHQIGRRKMHCGFRPGHGTLNMQQALARSCNVYFYLLGLEIGPQQIYHMAHVTGLGHATGVDLPVDKNGLIPTPTWKRIHRNESWTDGDTCNLSIGQGFALCTPIQMAQMMSVFANGGTVYAPRLIKEVHHENGREEQRPIRKLNKLAWSREHLRTVQEGMHDVIMADYGTAKAARVAGLDYAGKTGTAQYGARDQKKYRAWMIAYAPFDNPRYAVAIVVDEGSSSSVSASPKMKRIMEELFPVGMTTHSEDPLEDRS